MMDKTKLESILCDLYDQKINPQEVIQQIATLPYENLDFAKIDHHRSLRNGLPEVIYGKDKTQDQLISIIKSVYKCRERVRK